MGSVVLGCLTTPEGEGVKGKSSKTERLSNNSRLTITDPLEAGQAQRLHPREYAVYHTVKPTRTADDQVAGHLERCRGQLVSPLFASLSLRSIECIRLPKRSRLGYE